MVEQDRSDHVVYSTRLNLGNMLEGKTTFDSPYPDLAPSMELHHIGGAVGYAEIWPSDLASL